MRIGLNLLAFRPGHVGGAETYIRKLVEHLPVHAGADELIALMDRDLAASLATPGFRRVVAPAGSARVVAERVIEGFTPLGARSLARLVEASGVDVLLCPQQSIFPLRVGVPAVVTVHDLQHLAMPENFGLFDTHFRARVYPPSLARAARIIAISNVTRCDLVSRCAIAASRIEVVPHGFDAVERGAVEPWSAGGPYLYLPAATHPHKGHDVLLRTFAALRSRECAGWRLVFTGEQTAHWTKLKRLVRELQLEGDVLHRGFVPAAEVARAYAGAAAVVFPTRFEGFGIPVLEAVAHRKKVIVSRLPIFDELGVPKHWQVEFADPDQLARALEQDGPTQLEREPWSWSEVARRTLEILRGVASAAAAGVLR